MMSLFCGRRITHVGGEVHEVRLQLVVIGKGPHMAIILEGRAASGGQRQFYWPLRHLQLSFS